MREISAKEKEDEKKSVEDEKVGNDLGIKTEVKKEPTETEDETSEKINNLTDEIKHLNIKLEDDDGDGFAIRGPDGGKPTYYQYQSTDKPLPMPPMPNNFGSGQNYLSYHQPTQKQNRRMADEPPDPPFKYTRPAQNNCQPQFGMHPGYFNEVSQNSTPGMQNIGNQMSMFNFGGMESAAPAMTQMRFTGSSSGGKVTVQSPSSTIPPPFQGGNLADAFIDSLENVAEMGFDQLAQNVQSQHPPCTIQQNLCNDTYSSKAFKDKRRFSDPDSGLESADERSPYNAQTPSPAGSTYTSPPSVDSGCGRSPQYEPFPVDKNYGLYEVSSPPSYRTTPSPASTSGYGSPMAPQHDEDVLGDPKRLTDLADILDVISHDNNTDKNLRRSIESQQQEVSRMVQKTKVSQQPFPMSAVPNNNIQMVTRPQNAPAPSQTNVVQIPPHQIQAGMPTQTGMPTQPGVAVPAPLPAVGGQQSNIIILPPPTSSQPIYVIPVTQPAQMPKKPQQKQLRKILPKIPMSNATTGANGATTNTCPSNKTDVTMSTKVTPTTGGRNSGPNQAQAQQKMDRLLMIARRTVADIPREDLRKCDDEGDTYLHIAVCRTDKHMVRALLERLHREGLDSLVDQENNKRQTPLYLAVVINQPVMVDMFIKFQANVNVLAQNLSTDGTTTEVKAAIHVAAAHGGDYQSTLCELLKAKDLNINIVNNYGQTALHCAILAHGKAKRNSPERINSVEIIKTLLRHSADPTAQDKKSGKTPLMYAIEQRNLELVETILSHVEPEKVKNVVKTQAFDGSSCLKIAEGLKDSYNVQIWNRLWNSLQSAASGSLHRMPVQQIY